MTHAIDLSGGATNLLADFTSVRNTTVALAAPLSPEDCVVQSMPDVSPTKWHLAHTTWFFETFVLPKGDRPYEPFNERYGYLFNSYYEAVGPRHCRPRRGLLSRPSLDEVRAYRTYVDERMADLLRSSSVNDEVRTLTELGLHHEQQHQELLLTDIKHVLSCNPLEPAYRCPLPRPATESGDIVWVSKPGGLVQIGHDGSGFAFDNECPRHRTYMEPHALADRLVTSAEYAEFIEDDGYERPELWLSDGWNTVNAQGWKCPLYWRREGTDTWSVFTLEGRRPIDAGEPVCHISYYEADAYARWSGARLPTEEEWELAAQDAPVDGNLLESDHLHPVSAVGTRPSHLRQVYGDVWEWSQSPYSPYPGFCAPDGALGEYNGKFMCNQLVLRGGSCATPRSHIRATYRNFFPPDARWQFSGIRLCRSP